MSCASLSCLAVAPLFLAAHPHALAGEEDGFVEHDGRRYTVLVDATCVDAERKAAEWADLLDQAHRAYRDFFHAKASPTETSRFVVRVLPTVEAWQERILREGGQLPARVERVWYRQDNEHVYAVEQDREYWTRGQLLYGACQQYFGAVAPERRHLLYGWYLHGIASSFALHRWDGEDGQFAIVPWITDSGMPEAALATLDPANMALDRFNVEELDTAASWGVVTYLLEGADPKVRKRFEKLALGTTGSAVSSNDLAHAFGGPLGDLQGDLHRWLTEHRPPFELRSGWWEDVGGAELRADVRAGERGWCLLRPDATRLEADLAIPFGPEVAAGAILGHRESEVDGQRCFTAVVQDSHLTVARETGRDREVLAHLPVDARRGDTYRLRVERRADGVHVQARRVTAGPFDVPAGRWGLMVEHGAARFADVEWE